MKRLIYVLFALACISTVVYADTARPKGTTRFQTLSAQKQPLPSMELDSEFNNVVTAINNLSVNSNSSEWFDTGYSVTYISGTSFSVSSDKTAEFLATRRIKFDITGNTVYSEIVSCSYSSGTNTTTVIIADSVLSNPAIKVYYGIVKPIAQGGSVTAKLITGYPTSTGTTASTIPVRDVNGKVPGNITGDAATLGGYAPSVTSVANTIVQRNAAGEIVGTITGGSTTLSGYPADTGATALTIPVRDAAGKLPGDVLGNSATSTNATNHIAASTGAEHGATSTNTGNMIVRRDASGNFSAGVITASLTGNVTGSVTGNVTGNVTGSSGSTTGNAATATNATTHIANTSNPHGVTVAQVGAASGVTVVTSANIASQSVNSASSAGNADTLDGYHASSFQLVGTQPVAKAWVVYDATNGNILASYNVASVTIDIGSPSIARITFSSALTDANYVMVSGNNNSTGDVYYRPNYLVAGSTASYADVGCSSGKNTRVSAVFYR